MLVQILVELQNTREIFISVTVIGSTPDGGKLAAKQLLIAIFAQLVRTIYSSHFVFLEESLANVLAEDVAGAASGHAEPIRVCFGITPHEIGEGALVRNLLHSLNVLDVIDVLDGRRQAAMHCKDLVINNRADRQIVKHISEHGPDSRITILLLALELEPINCSDLPCFVVSANQANAVWVPQLKQEEQRDGLDGVRATIDVVSEEQVVRVRHVAAHFEQFQHVIELAMDIADERDGAAQHLNVILCRKDLLDFRANDFDG